MKAAAYVSLAAIADKVVEKHAKAEPDGVVIVNGADLKPEPIRWLWPGWIALGKLLVFAGAPGLGKTTIALAFIATLTRGARWPDGSRCEAGNALIWSGEDDPIDTLLPRLLAMGADPRRVYFIKAARVAGEVVPFDPARDMVQLVAEAQRIGDVRLLLVDPVVSVVAGDSHKNTEVRRALQPLVDLAAAVDCAVIGISHFNKGGAGREPLERVVGSVAFGAVARVVLVAAKVKSDDGEDRRIVARAKSNIGPDGGGFDYRIEQSPIDAAPGMTASAITWGDPLEGTARELLAEADDKDGDADEGASALDDACEFLRCELSGGPKPSKYLLGEARQAGHSERTLKRAKSRLGVESRKTGTVWEWALRPEDGKDAKGAKVSTSENLGTVGTLGPVAARSEVF
jgi:RecA-family ATPase